MDIDTYLIIACWLAFLCYWVVAAFGAKKSVRNANFRKGIYARFALLIMVIAVLHFTGNAHPLRSASGAARDGFARGFFSSSVVRSIGVAICALGFALAIWARVHIGRNWGMPMSLREKPELVTSGPYARIRHPIYTGVLTALIGTTLAIGPVVLIPFGVACVYFVYAASKEERTMVQQFPRAYAEYRNRTNMLIPFVW